MILQACLYISHYSDFGNRTYTKIFKVMQKIVQRLPEQKLKGFFLKIWAVMLTKHICDKCGNKLLHYMDEMILRNLILLHIIVLLYCYIYKYNTFPLKHTHKFHCFMVNYCLPGDINILANKSTEIPIVCLYWFLSNAVSLVTNAIDISSDIINSFYF